jgi:transglutaminase-like putative cysteine protease
VLYDLTLRITYAYESETLPGRQRLCVVPATLADVQRCLAATLTVTPAPNERGSFTDFWGNHVDDFAFRARCTTLEYLLEARVERSATARSPDAATPVAAIGEVLASEARLGPASPHHFLDESPRVALDDAMRRYARRLLRPGASTADAVVALGQALHADMTFDADATHVHTRATEAFAQRRGVCQDFTHVMIACLRGIGVPAGYVSGYLRTNPRPGQPRLAGADAMHAWVRAWCGPAVGWIEYDPTNATIASEDHVIVAYGRDYSDVAPVRGVLKTAGSQLGEHAVDVVPVDGPDRPR